MSATTQKQHSFDNFFFVAKSLYVPPIRCVDCSCLARALLSNLLAYLENAPSKTTIQSLWPNVQFGSVIVFLGQKWENSETKL